MPSEPRIFYRIAAGVALIVLLCCLSAASAENPYSGSDLTNLTVNSAISPAEPFITIDPIGNHTIGEVFFINGTTNLPVSEKLTMNIESYKYVMRPHLKSDLGPPLGEYAYHIPVILMTSTIPGTNRWSVNLTDIAKKLASEEYLVLVSSRDTTTGAVFTLLPANYGTTSTVLQTIVQNPPPVQPTTSVVIVPPTTQIAPLPLALPITVLATLVILRPFHQKKRD